MRTRRLLPLVLAAAACRKTPLPATLLQLTTYADLRHKVSIQYSAPWALTRQIESYLPGPALGLQLPPSAVFSVGRDDEPRLRPSDFSGAEMVYAVRAGLTPQTCAALAGPRTAVVGGTAFAYGEIGDAGMMHQRSDRVYSIMRGANCFLFDLALLRLSNNATRPMTARELFDVETELTQLLSSVRFQ